MQNAGERAYAYAKACGIIGKSFVGKRASALAGLRSLSELDRLVFPDPHRELPGRELLVDLEDRILRRTARHILAALNSFASPPELFIRMVRSWEYAGLKAVLRHIAAGIKTPPPRSDAGPFGTVRFDAFPDLAAMIAGTEFEPILGKDGKALQGGQFDLTQAETELDLHYYRSLTESLRRLSAGDRLFAEHILAEEISLRNCVWALRLRTYFKKSAAETAQYLMNIPVRLSGGPIPGGLRPRASAAVCGTVSLAAEALASLELPLDSRSAWKFWRWERFLNPEKSGESWAADPRYFQNAASEYLYRFSLRCFRRMPFSLSSVFCYIKLKQFEEDLLTSVAEGLGLGMTGGEVFSLLEVPL